MKKLAISSGLFFALHLLAFAAPLDNVRALVTTLGNIIGSLIPILIALAMVVFFWGLVRYIWGTKGVPSHDEGKKIMIAGLVGLFIMVAVWGIILFAGQALGI